jgi:LPXTG-motif cell wall-anchored protein
VAAKRPGGGLPGTGANALPLLVAGLVLFGIGAATVRAARRR